MKTQLFFMVVSIYMLLISCSEIVAINLAEDSLETDVKSSTWQEQIKFAQSNASTRSSNDAISLLEYTYIGKIKDEKEKSLLIKQLFSDDSYTVRYIDSSNYEIVSLKKIRSDVKALGGEEPFNCLKNQLEKAVKVGMDLIELKWEYKGETYYSTAIASNECGGIIFDHIGHVIPNSKREKAIESKVKSRIPALKSKSETKPDKNSTFHLEEEVYDQFNVLSYKYCIDCTSVFNDNGILIDRSLGASHSSGLGWSCDANVRTLNGEINVSDYHEFAWAYSYGYNCTITIGFNGTGFSISGSGTGKSGTKIHRLLCCYPNNWIIFFYLLTILFQSLMRFDYI